MVRVASLRDAVGSIGVGSINYTWSHPDGSTHSRIDFLFTSRTVEHKWHSMVPCYFSDHRAIHFQGVLGKGFPPGPGSWKLNCALLEREEIVEELRGAYKMWKLDKVYFPTVAQWWEFMKVNFRSFFQVKGRRQECERRSELRRLQKKLHSLQDLQLCGWDVRKELDETKEGLKRHFEEESRRIIFRSKVEHLEKGEKCNSYFFRKLHSAHTPLIELRDRDGRIQEGKEELFAECIRRNPEIRGITAPIHGRQEAKCSLYMDDVTIFCADEQSVKELVQTCEDFGKASGAKVNCGKSETMLFGEWHLSSDPFPFPIRTGLIKILGVWFGGKGAALKCDERLAKVRQKFGLWSLRDLTIEGKILVLQNEILPVLQYMAQAWPPLATICRAITRAVFHFIWGSKMDRVKRVVMYKEPHKGGKGVPDIPTMLRAFFVCNCVRRTLRESDQGSAGNAMSRFFLLPLWRGLGWERWDSSIPYNWTTPWFYQDVGRFVRENQLEGVKPELWTPKVIYKLIRAKDIIETISGLPAATSKMVWQNLSSGRLTNRHKDTAWMAIQGGLSLRSFMHARNLCRYRHCPRGCVAEETALHVFWQCPFAQALLDDLENELKDSVPKRHLSYHSVLYGLFPGTHSYGAIQEAWRIMCCVKDALWFARNRLVLRREQVTTQDCRRLIHSLLRDYNILDSPEEED
ncbi:LOW QUALITY PROTEIN: uncharacterized protein WCC33_011438 [Rhinophrynus dorsalis]